ncbi:ATP-grasp domain-containing protein [Chitinophaga sp. HK235]|uniref:ATP-grasp domain-containing protein n=1 Tax=Chitinophaga sp. HK235 TaxID=2952571 RepID=UPI001BAA3489|nr:ATP-grasp domain-containing protein [Chitinophaga sp. HK235]
MQSSFKNIQWVVQQNLTNQEDLKMLKDSCEKTGVKYQEVFVIPFSDALPSFDTDPVNISAKSRVLVSEPYNIAYEWRLWIVNKKVITASQYRKYFQLNKKPGCPAAVIEFAEARCQEYTPNDIFVMDVCLCGDEYFIVECGCMNSAGFYKGDIERIVKEVTTFFAGC